jgi:serine/threonine protein kinase
MKRSSRQTLSSTSKQELSEKKTGTKIINFLRRVSLSDSFDDESTDSMEGIAKWIHHKRDVSKTYNWIEKIYEGKYIYVMHGKRITDGKKVIGKFLNAAVYKKKTMEQYILSEIFYHSQLVTHNISGIVELTDFYLNTDGWVVIVEPELNPCNPKTETEIRDYFRQLLQTVNLIHQYGFIHHDIKCDNILVVPESNRIQLIDFGLTTTVDNSDCDHSDHTFGTPGFSPEDAQCTTAFDIYCCGSVLERWYKNAELDMDLNAKDLVKKMKDWMRCRPTAANALTHPYFTL